MSGDDRLVRTYVVTGGRSAPSRNTFDHINLISLSSSAPHLSRAHLNTEHMGVLGRLAHRGPESVAELSAHLSLPVSVLRILLADLLESGHISTQQRITDSTADRPLLERVLAGLRRY